MCKFGHLHVHTEYSTLDGMIKVEELIQTVKSYGQTFVAITDHGNTSALWEAQKYGDEHGVKVIFGCEFYMQLDDNSNGHQLVLAKNNRGLENLFKLQRLAQDNFYKKPRITWDDLHAHKDGLIITTTCLASPFNQYILANENEKAYLWARRAQYVFGDDFYIEIQPNQIMEQRLCNKESIAISDKLRVKLVATNDVHYALESDCFPHEVLLALQTNKKMSDEKRFKFSTTDFWLKTEAEMLSSFYDVGINVFDATEAMENTRKIADKCDARIDKGNFLPKYYDVEYKTERQTLVENTMKGAKQYALQKDKDFMDAVQNEIDVIDRNGYSGYFAIVSDYVNASRKSGIIVGDGRGSGAGSKVAYLTGITKIPPHNFDLLFERFMADGRQPDFDVDFSDQDSVFSYLQSKYGYESVGRIISFGTLSPKAVLRKVLNVFDHPISLQNQISKLIPDLCKSLNDAYVINPQLLDYKKKFKTEWEVIERLEGVVSHESKHAGGIIIYPNLPSILPVKVNEGMLVVCFDKYMLEEIGHYKFDILGLETLPIIKNCLDSLPKNIDLHNIPLDDEKVYDMLCTGDVSGVFQINSQSGKVIQQQPRNFKDLIAINALIRPGVGDWNEYLARRQGKEWFKDPNRPWMHETLGVMTYQEQYLLDGHKLAGWSIADADKWLRKNKDIRNDDALAQKFLDDTGAMSNKEHAFYINNVWNEIVDTVAGGYGFNKSHSASYAMLTYQTAYLKCHYPVHWYAALMTGEKTDGDGQNEISQLISECQNKGIKISPPDINLSGDSYRVVDDSIHYRINTIKHVGETAVNWIISNRPFESFDDFISKRERSTIRQNVLINLIKAGCFDFDDTNRAKLLWKVDMLNRTKTEIKNGAICHETEWNETVKAEWEMEVLGMYLTANPLQKYGFKKLDSYPDQGSCIQGGRIYDLRVFKDSKGNEMAFVNLNTLHGNVKLVCFSRTWANDIIKTLSKVDQLVIVEGRRSGNDILVDNMEVLK